MRTLFLALVLFAACADTGASAPNYNSADDDDGGAAGRAAPQVSSTYQNITGAHPLLAVPGIQFGAYPNAWTSDAFAPQTPAMRFALQCYESLFQDPGGAFDHFHPFSTTAGEMIDKSNGGWYARIVVLGHPAPGITETGLYRKKVSACAACPWTPIATSFFKTAGTIYPVAGGFDQVSFGNVGNHDPSQAGTNTVSGRGICFTDSASASTGKMWSDL